jgi:OFA family oxalate/formate antiporter-like MFS transporter
MALGVLFFVVIVGFAQLLADPPAGYVPPHSYDKPVGPASPHAPEREYEWREMLKTPSFAILWITYACAAFAGLMIISIVAKIMPLQMPGAATETGVVVVAALALGDAIGRPACGALSDRIGRRYTMLAVFLGQALVVGVLGLATSWPLLAAAAFLIGLNYGANLALFPATTFDFFGTRNGGVNYGLVFTAWGVGGVFGSQLAAFILDVSRSAASPSGSYAMAYAVASAMCLAAAGLTLLARPPKLVPVVRQRASDVAVHVKTPA